MKTIRRSWTARLTFVFVLAVFGISLVVNAAEDGGFSSSAARTSRAPGSPVGPPPRIIICHKGKTISVAEPAVPAHLAHGDTLGPCADDVVICHQGKSTITVNENNLSGHQAHGDTLGPCAQDVFMCNNLGHTIVVGYANIPEHLARGHALGLCPGKTLLCHKGRTIKVDDSSVPAHLGHGDYVGYCLGSQGPLISSNNVPPQAAH